MPLISPLDQRGSVEVATKIDVQRAVTLVILVLTSVVTVVAVIGAAVEAVGYVIEVFRP